MDDIVFAQICIERILIISVTVGTRFTNTERFYCTSKLRKNRAKKKALLLTVLSFILD